MGRGRRTVFAGFWGGLLAGALDAGFTLASAGGRVLGPTSSLYLLLIEITVGAAVGAALAIMFLGWSLALERLLGKSRWVSGSHAVALLLVAPLLVYDAFALFHGAKASRIPAHELWSAVLIAAGLLAVWLGVTLWRWLLTRFEARADASGPPGAPGVLLALGIVFLLAAVGLAWANQNVLPRLYPWFHLTLTLAELLLCVLAVRVFLGRRPRVLGTRSTVLVVVTVGLVLLVAGLALRPAFGRSQRLRFYVYEKTHLASIFARALTPRSAGPKQSQPDVVSETPPPLLPEGPRRPGADVVLITIDALRADHVGAYGYARPTTPNLDAFAKDAVRFERAYTQAPHTSFAVASLMIGKYYPTLARLGSPGSHETLAAVLRRYGWKTAAFFPPAVFYIDAHKMKAFESTSFDFEYVKYEYLDAEARVGQIEAFLEAENPQKLFLWLHLFEPHEPYQTHPGFDFGGRDVDRYDSEIAYSDKVVGKVLALLRAKRPGAIVIVASDHGEELGEHGGRYHGTTLFDEQVRVPLLVSVPGLPPRVLSGPVELVDIPATILGLLDIPVPLRMRGTNLGPWLGAEVGPEHPLPPVFAEVEDKRMVALGLEKLICDVGRDYCSYFDLAADPGEQHDQADQRPERVAALRAHLDAWLARQARYEGERGEDGQGGGALADAIERGRLGDVRAVEPLAQGLGSAAPLAARREAARLLATALPPRADAKQVLLAAASQPGDEELGAWAAIAALRAGAPEAEARVRELAAAPAGPESPPWLVHAVLVLPDGGGPAGSVALVGALEDCGSDVGLCKRVLAALGRLKAPATVRALLAHLPFVQTRPETVSALGELGDGAAVGALVGALESDPYVSVRAAAAEALGRLGGARAVQGLEAALRREREDVVRLAVQAALARLGRSR